MELVEEMILREWKRAGGEYALAARLVRIDIEKEKKQEDGQP